MNDQTNPNQPPNWSAIWAQRVADAQKTTRMTVCSIPFERIPYGTDHPDGAETCRDCGVSKGMLHVDRCCIEKCPVCAMQAAWCGCADGPGDDGPEEVEA